MTTTPRPPSPAAPALTDWISSHRGRKAALARYCGVSTVTVSGWASGRWLPAPKYRPSIEAATGGAVSASAWPAPTKHSPHPPTEPHTPVTPAAGTPPHVALAEWLDAQPGRRKHLATSIGVSVAAIKNWQRGKALPGIQYRAGLAEVTGIPVESWPAPQRHRAPESDALPKTPPEAAPTPESSSEAPPAPETAKPVLHSFELTEIESGLLTLALSDCLTHHVRPEGVPHLRSLMDKLGLQVRGPEGWGWDTITRMAEERDRAAG